MASQNEPRGQRISSTISYIIYIIYTDSSKDTTGYPLIRSIPTGYFFIFLLQLSNPFLLGLPFPSIEDEEESHIHMRLYTIM